MWLVVLNAPFSLAGAIVCRSGVSILISSSPGSYEELNKDYKTMNYMFCPRNRTDRFHRYCSVFAVRVRVNTGTVRVFNPDSEMRESATGDLNWSKL